MGEVLLYHHVQGLTEGVRAFGDRLRQAGHTVHTPDLFDGRSFETLEDGVEGGCGIEQTRQDVRFAFRGFRRAPAFVITVVATIALALGLNTTAFTIFNAYVLRPISVRDPYSLYQMAVVDRRGSQHGASWKEYEELRALRPPASVFALRHAFAQ